MNFERDELGILPYESENFPEGKSFPTRTEDGTVFRTQEPILFFAKKALLKNLTKAEDSEKFKAFLEDNRVDENWPNAHYYKENMKSVAVLPIVDKLINKMGFYDADIWDELKKEIQEESAGPMGDYADPLADDVINDMLLTEDEFASKLHAFYEQPKKVISQEIERIRTLQEELEIKYNQTKDEEIDNQIENIEKRIEGFEDNLNMIEMNSDSEYEYETRVWSGIGPNDAVIDQWHEIRDENRDALDEIVATYHYPDVMSMNMNRSAEELVNDIYSVVENTSTCKNASPSFIIHFKELCNPMTVTATFNQQRQKAENTAFKTPEEIDAYVESLADPNATINQTHSTDITK